MDTILVVNAGSSSVKFQVDSAEGDGFSSADQGQMDGIGSRPPACGRSGASGDPLADRAYPIEAVSDVPPRWRLPATGCGTSFE